MPIPFSSIPKDYILFGGFVYWFPFYPLYPGGPPDIDEMKYPLLNSLFRVIKKLATGVDNEIRQSNKKLAIINTKIPNKAVSIVFDIVRLYTFCRVCVFGSQLRNKVQIKKWPWIKTFTNCNINKLYLIILNLLAYFSLYTCRRFWNSVISCFSLS